eukprot:4555730-Pleurochrysis_carterae.AAC.1
MAMRERKCPPPHIHAKTQAPKGGRKKKEKGRKQGGRAERQKEREGSKNPYLLVNRRDGAV